MIRRRPGGQTRARAGQGSAVAGWRGFEPRILPEGYSPWLREPGSLTARLLRKRPPNSPFRVAVHFQGRRRLARDEARALDWPGRRWGQVREVCLYLGHLPVVYARTVLPASGGRHPWRAWERIGNRALGSILFADRCIRLGGLAFRALKPAHPLYHPAAARLPLAVPVPPGGFPARRALFYLHRCPLLVSEVFLPDVLGLK